MDQTLTRQEMTQAVSRPSRRAQRWLAVGALLAAALILWSLLLPLATVGLSDRVAYTVRFVDLPDPPTAVIPAGDVQPGISDPLFPYVDTTVRVEPDRTSSGLSRLPLPGPWLIVVISATVAIAALTLGISAAWPSRWAPSVGLVVTAGLAAALAGFGEAVTAAVSPTRGWSEVDWNLHVGAAPFVLLLGALLAVGVLSAAIVLHRDRRHAPNVQGRAGDVWGCAMAAWLCLGVATFVALMAGAIVGSYDEHLAGLWYHLPLFLPAFVAAPGLMLVGWAPAVPRRRTVLVWSTAALAVIAIWLVAQVMLTTEVVWLD